MAPPTKLTDELADRIVHAIGAFASYRHAAQLAGIAESTFHAWMARGREELDRREAAESACEPRASERPYVELVERVERAGAQACVRAAALVAKAGEHDWRAAAWLLERRDPETYGKRQRIELRGSETAPLSIVAVDDRRAAAAAHEFLKRIHGLPRNGDGDPIELAGLGADAGQTD